MLLLSVLILTAVCLTLAIVYAAAPARFVAAVDDLERSILGGMPKAYDAISAAGRRAALALTPPKPALERPKTTGRNCELVGWNDLQSMANRMASDGCPAILRHGDDGRDLLTANTCRPHYFDALAVTHGYRLISTSTDERQTTVSTYLHYHSGRALRIATHNGYAVITGI